MRNRLLQGLMLALVFFSCSSRPPGLLLDTDVTTVEVLARRVNEQTGRLHSIVGRGTLSFESPELAGTAAFSSSLKRPDSLLILLEGPFGIDLGTFFLTRERYVVYNSMENRVITGVPGSQSLKAVIPFDLTFEEMVNAFAGVFSLPTSNATRFVVEDDRFRISYACGENECEYWVDPSFLLVTRFVQRSPDGSVVVEAQCSSLTEDSNATAPKRISVRFPGQRRKLSISYTAITLNSPDPSFAFSVPDNARTIVR